MNALSNDRKLYVHILELHAGITNENVRDSIPLHKIATHEESSDINWAWILANGLMPIVKASPTILKSTMKDYLFTPEFWICDCESDWLHSYHYECNTCHSTVFHHMQKHQDSMPTTAKLWGKGPFKSLETTVLEGMVSAVKKKDRVLGTIEVLYKHLKAFDFNWIKAFAIENF
jgi:hypothetical protein